MTDLEMDGLKSSVSVKQETNGFQCYSLKTEAIIIMNTQKKLETRIS